MLQRTAQVIDSTRRHRKLLEIRLSIGIINGAGFRWWVRVVFSQKFAAWPAKAGCNCSAHYRLCCSSVKCATGGLPIWSNDRDLANVSVECLTTPRLLRE